MGAASFCAIYEEGSIKFSAALLRFPTIWEAYPIFDKEVLP